VKKVASNPIIIHVFECNKEDVQEPYIPDRNNKEKAYILVFERSGDDSHVLVFERLGDQISTSTKL